MHIASAIWDKELIPDPQVESAFSSFMLDPEHVDLALFFASDDEPGTVSELAKYNMVGHFPSGTSFQTLNHFRQLIQKGTFEKYDYGFEENYKRYGQMQPPTFDLSKINTVPIAMFMGSGDLLASPKDYKWTIDQMVNANIVYQKEYPKMGHMYFLAPTNAKEVFSEYTDLIKKYNPYYKEELNPYFKNPNHKSVYHTAREYEDIPKETVGNINMSISLDPKRQTHQNQNEAMDTTNDE